MSKLHIWLKHHKGPWEKVKEEWAQTHELRRRHITEMDSEMVYLEWPLLKHSMAPSLVSIILQS